MTLRCGLDGVSSQTRRVSLVELLVERRDRIGGEVVVARLDAHVAQHAFEEPERAAVDVVGAQDPLTGQRQGGDRLRRRRAAGERQSVAAALERGDRRLETRRASGCRCVRIPSRRAAGRRPPGRTSPSGRSVARRRRSAHRAPCRRGRPACRAASAGRRGQAREGGRPRRVGRAGLGRSCARGHRAENSATAADCRWIALLAAEFPARLRERVAGD